MEQGAAGWKPIASTVLTPVVAVAAFLLTERMIGPYLDALPQAWVRQAQLGENLARVVTFAPLLIVGVGAFLILYALMRKGLGLPLRGE